MRLSSFGLFYWNSVWKPTWPSLKKACASHTQAQTHRNTNTHTQTDTHAYVLNALFYVYLSQHTGNWQWLFARLPNGINQLLIEGLLHAGHGNESGIMVDDVTVKSCDQFGEFFPIQSACCLCSAYDILFNVATDKLVRWWWWWWWLWWLWWWNDNL